MSNLGSSDTPIEAQNLGLPAGSSIAEDNGDFVVKDSSGTIVFRRNESANEWQFEGTDITGVGSLSTDELSHTYPSGNSDGLTPLKEVTDADDTNTFDMDATGLDAHNAYILHYRLQDHSGNSNNVRVQVEQDSNANYNYGNVSGSFSSNQTSWAVGQIFVSSRSVGRVCIYAGGDVVAPTNTFPMYYSRSSRASGHSHAGRYSVDVAQVSDVRLFTGFNATGQATVLGYDYP